MALSTEDSDKLYAQLQALESQAGQTPTGPFSPVNTPINLPPDPNATGATPAPSQPQPPDPNATGATPAPAPAPASAPATAAPAPAYFATSPERSAAITAYENYALDHGIPFTPPKGNDPIPEIGQSGTAPQSASTAPASAPATAAPAPQTPAPTGSPAPAPAPATAAPATAAPIPAPAGTTKPPATPPANVSTEPPTDVAVTETPEQMLARERKTAFKQLDNNQIDLDSLRKRVDNYMTDSKNRDVLRAADHAKKQEQYQWNNDRDTAAYKLSQRDFDPVQDYWSKRGPGSRVMTTLAAMASGFSQGWIGKGGNPILDQLHKDIGNNYDQHRDQVKDLYQNMVESGKIKDTEENRFNVENAAEQTYRRINLQAFQDQVSNIGASTTNSNAKLIAANAAQLAEQAKKKEADDFATASGNLFVSKQNSTEEQRKDIASEFETRGAKYVNLGYSPLAARIAAANDMIASGRPPEQIAPIVKAVGGSYDPVTKQFVGPTEKPLVQDPNNPVPTVTAMGGPVPLKDQKEDEKLVVPLDNDPDIQQLVGGKKKVLANNIKDQEDAQNMINGRAAMKKLYDELVDKPEIVNETGPDGKFILNSDGSFKTKATGKTLPGFITKWRNHKITDKEIGQWDADVQPAIDGFQAASAGANRVTTGGIARNLGENFIPESPAAWEQGNLIAGGADAVRAIQGAYDVADGKAKAIKQFLDSLPNKIVNRLRVTPVKIDEGPPVR